MDKYKSFAELKKNEEAGKDYIIQCRHTDSETAVMALHGGGIEPGTIDLADAIAGKDFSFYAFSGIKKRGNSILHIASTRFDEPAALEIACRANTAVTIHGSRDKEEVVFIGGKNNNLKHSISEKLICSGFNVKKSQNNC